MDDNTSHAESQISGTFSHTLSIFTHPALLPLVAAVMILFIPGFTGLRLPVQYKIYCIGVVAFFTLALPAVAIFMLKRIRLLQTDDISDRRDRLLAMAISVAAYAMMLRLTWTMALPGILKFLLTTAGIALAVAFVIHFFRIVSLHALGWGAWVATWFFITLSQPASFIVLIISVLIAGIAGYARLAQKAHSPAQVYWGYAAGIASVLIFYFFI